MSTDDLADVQFIMESVGLGAFGPLSEVDYSEATFTSAMSTYANTASTDLGLTEEEAWMFVYQLGARLGDLFH